MENLYKFPPFLTQHLVEVAQNYRDGIFSGANDVVEKMTGTPPLTVQQFIAQNRAASPERGFSDKQGLAKCRTRSGGAPSVLWTT